MPEVDLTELNKLEEYLRKNNIQYERIDEERITDEYFLTRRMERHQIGVPEIDPDGRSWDAICQYGSYGYEEGLLEIMGDIVCGPDTVEGYLTADDIIRRLES